MASLQDVRKDIEATLAAIREIEKQIIEENDNSSNHESMKRALNDYITKLEQLYTTASKTVIMDEGDPVEIPVDIVEFVDQGKNPDECMRMIMSSVLSRAQQAKGKSAAFHMLNDTM